MRSRDAQAAEYSATRLTHSGFGRILASPTFRHSSIENQGASAGDIDRFLVFQGMQWFLCVVPGLIRFQKIFAPTPSTGIHESHGKQGILIHMLRYCLSASI